MPGIMDVFHRAFDTNKTSFSLKPPRFHLTLPLSVDATDMQRERLTLLSACKNYTWVNMQEGRMHRPTRKGEHGFMVKGTVLSTGQKSPFIMPNELYHIDRLC